MTTKDCDTIQFMTANAFRKTFPTEKKVARWLERNGWSALFHTLTQDGIDLLVLPKAHLNNPVHTIVHELCERDVVWLLFQMGFLPGKDGIVAPIQNTFVSHIMSPYKDSRWGKFKNLARVCYKCHCSIDKCGPENSVTFNKNNYPFDGSALCCCHSEVGGCPGCGCSV